VDPIVFSASETLWKSFSLILLSTLWMSDTVSKRYPFSFIFELGNKAKSQGPKSGELLLVTNSVAFRDVWAGAFS
jgi:hypothetical protein